MTFRPRLIPSVILAATILLGLKVSDIFSVGTHALAQAPTSGQATGAPLDLTSQANAAKTPPAAATAKPSEAAAPKQAQANAPQLQMAAAQQAGAAKTAAVAAPTAATPAAQSDAAKPDSSAKPVAANSDAAKSDTAKTDAATSDAGKSDAAKPGEQSAEAPATGSDPAQRVPPKDPLLLSPAEIQILQELSQRRTQLDKRASELDRQQVVLQAAEKRIDEKIAKLEALQKSIQADVDKQTAADDARTQSMVKIYETMKPADAAQILSQLNMPDLLLMLGHMKEAKTAPILAAMDPTKAQAITAAMMQKQTPPTAIPAAAPAKP